MRVVVDANVLVSALISKAGPARAIVTAWGKERFELVVSPTLLNHPLAVTGLTPDPDDDYLVSLARAARAEYVVSGDRHLTGLVDPLPPVLTPRQFLDLLGA